eukprot:3511974-Rhodomonas_salina.2
MTRLQGVYEAALGDHWGAKDRQGERGYQVFCNASGAEGLCKTALRLAEPEDQRHDCTRGHVKERSRVTNCAASVHLANLKADKLSSSETVTVRTAASAQRCCGMSSTRLLHTPPSARQLRFLPDILVTAQPEPRLQP